MPKNIHTWWTMKEKLEKEDREYEEAKERERDEQLRAAEELYWKRKKEQEEAEKKVQEEEKKEAENTDEVVPEVVEKAEEKGTEVELYCCFIHQNRIAYKIVNSKDFTREKEKNIKEKEIGAHKHMITNTTAIIQKYFQNVFTRRCQSTHHSLHFSIT